MIQTVIRDVYKIRVVKEATDIHLPHNLSATATTLAEDDVQAKLVAGLPEDLSTSERAIAQQLFLDYVDVFSRGPFDMGRTTLVSTQVTIGRSGKLSDGTR